MKKLITLLMVMYCANNTNAQDEQTNRYEVDLNAQREAVFKSLKDPLTNTIRYDLIYKALETRANARVLKSRSWNTLKWNELGPKNVAGRVSEMAFTRTTKLPFAGGDMGGVWFNSNINANNAWKLKTPNNFNYYNISSVATHPLNKDIIYFATGKVYGNIIDKPGNGVYKSIDGGVTWNQVSVTRPSNCSNKTAFISKIKVAFNGDVFIATAPPSLGPNLADTNGIFILNDANDSLKTFIGSKPNGKGFDIEKSSNDDMWISCLSDPASTTQRALYRAHWNGSKWQAIPQLSSGGSGSSPLPINDSIIRVELACAPNDANVVYALYYMKSFSVRVFKTINGVTSAGSMWQECTNPQTSIPSVFGSQIQRDLAIVVDPNNKDIVYIGSLKVGRGVFNVFNATWSDISTAVMPHVDISSLVFYPNSSKELYACTDGGIYKCKDPSTTASWTHNSLNLNITQLNGCAMNNTTERNFLTSAHDNGTQWFKNASGISNSTKVGESDGLSCFMGTKLTTIGTNNLYKVLMSNNFGTAGQDFNFGLHTDAVSSAPYIACPQFLALTPAPTPSPCDLDDANDALITKSTISGSVNFYTNINTTTCASIQSQTVSVPSMIFDPSCIKVSPEASSTVKRFYLATDAGRLFRVNWTSGGFINATSFDITGPLPIGSGEKIVSIDIQGTSDNEIVVTYMGTGSNVQNIFYTSNHNATTNAVPTWTALESTGISNIQGLPIRTAKFIRGGGNNIMNAKIVIGTEIGCYYTTLINGTSTIWLPDENGPDIPVTQLQYRPNSDGLLLMSTYGRGLWYSSTFMGAGSSLDFDPYTNGCKYALVNTSPGATGTVEWDLNNDGIFPDAIGNTVTTCMASNASDYVTMRIGGISITKQLVDLTPSSSGGAIPPCCLPPPPISRIKHIDEVYFFPNPTNGLLNIKGLISDLEKIEVCNLQGQKIKVFEDISSSVLDIQELKVGLYLFNVHQTNGEKKVYRITKE